ncbi:hypothetical protein IE877_15995 [Methylomonas sp. EbA]|uniref:Uncharacterized protein n=1 Tax=Methylomonas albis TaxID=1854563 RepID=A0ABR9D2M1_9GAMM|nr:hypothetical protein [Methylomonas albis]
MPGYSLGYLRNEIVDPVYPKRHTPSKLDAFADKLSQWLADEARNSRKQRRFVKQLHADLCVLGFEGSYDRVAVFVCEIWARLPGRFNLDVSSLPEKSRRIQNKAGMLSYNPPEY